MNISHFLAPAISGAIIGTGIFTIAVAICYSRVVFQFNGLSPESGVFNSASDSQFLTVEKNSSNDHRAPTIGDTSLVDHAPALNRTQMRGSIGYTEDMPTLGLLSSLDYPYPSFSFEDWMNEVSDFLISTISSFLPHSPFSNLEEEFSDNTIMAMGGASGLELALDNSLAEGINQLTQDSLDSLDTMHRVISGTPIGSPVLGDISSLFGYRRSPFSGRRAFHSGIDLAAEYGSPVVSSADGTVVYAGRKGGYGKTVIIRHRNGLETLYGHLSKVLVKRGAKICRGQNIALVGSTGRSTGPHLHYEVRKQGRIINPKPYIELASTLRFAQ